MNIRAEGTAAATAAGLLVVVVVVVVLLLVVVVVVVVLLLLPSHATLVERSMFVLVCGCCYVQIVLSDTSRMIRVAGIAPVRLLPLLLLLSYTWWYSSFSNIDREIHVRVRM